MAITAVGSLGTANNKSTNRTLSVTPSRAVAAGAVVVVWYSNPSLFSAGNPTNAWNFFKCSDSQGNIYATIGSQTDSRDFEEIGAMGVLFVTQVRYPLSTSDTITVECDSGLFASSTWARAMSVEEFDFGGMRYATGTSYSSSFQAYGSDPVSISKSMTGNTREVLFLHLLSVEGPNTDTYTWDSDYTQITGAGTTGGADDTNMHIRGGYRIASLSSDTVDVTSNTADRDHCQVMNVLCAVPAHPTGFPNTPILDDFNRANESPLGNGTWNTTEFAYGGAHMTLVSNAATSAGGSWWEDEWESCAEAYVTATTFGAGIHLHFFGDGNTSPSFATMYGHGLWWTDGAPSGGFLGGDPLFFGQSGNQGRVSNPAQYVWIDKGNGVKVGLQRTKPVNGGIGVDHLWVDLGDGWGEVAAMFVVYSDSGGTQFGVGKAAIGAESSAVLDNFGGGMMPCGRFIPQYYRHTRGVA